jgi:hypothetical protein
LPGTKVEKTAILQKEMYLFLVMIIICLISSDL